MRTPAQWEADRLRPGKRSRTGSPIQGVLPNVYVGGAAYAATDQYRSWSGSTVTGGHYMRFGLSGQFGLGSGVFA